jgi:SAM-dependent methyltransferase
MTERQTAIRLQDIRSDHVERYKYIFNSLKPGARVLDVACGIGYGSYLLSRESEVSEVVAIDRSFDAVLIGKQHYAHPSIRWIVADVYDLDHLALGQFDCICSFETLEHLPRDKDFLSLLVGMMKPGSLLFISTPNEDVMRFDPVIFPYHIRHYTSLEFLELLQGAGLSVIGGGSQILDLIEPYWGGRFNLAVCRRMDKAPSVPPEIRTLTEIIRGMPLSVELLSTLGSAQIVNMLRDGVFSWDYLFDLLQSWASQGSEAACYLLAIHAEELGQIDDAQAYLQQRLINAQPGEAAYLSALYHLGRLSQGTERRNWLKQCLRYEPEHRAALALLEQDGMSEPLL